MSRLYAFAPEELNREQAAIRKGELQQIGNIIKVPVTALGLVEGRSGFAGGTGWLELPISNGLALLANVAYPSSGGPGAAQISSTTAQIWVQFNTDSSPWILFDWNVDSLNQCGFSGTIFRVRFAVKTIDSSGQDNMFLVPLTAAGLISSGHQGGGSTSGGTAPSGGAGGGGGA